MSNEVVPIIGGTGALGFGVGLRLARAGTPIVIGSRSAERAAESAEKLASAVPGADVRGLENPEAAQQGPIVLLCVPFRNQSENLTNLKGVLQPGQILVDATVPLAAAVSGRATRAAQPKRRNDSRTQYRMQMCADSRTARPHNKGRSSSYVCRSATNRRT